LEAHFPQTAAFLNQVLTTQDFLGSLAPIEQGLLTSLKADGARLLEWVLHHPDRPLAQDQARPGEEDFGMRGKTVLTVLGWINLRRRYYYDAARQQGRFALDEGLKLVDSYSPLVSQWMCRASASAGSYHAASGDLLAYAGLAIDERQLQRLVQRLGPDLAQWRAAQPAGLDPRRAEVFCVSADGTGAPMRRKELRGRKGKQPDGSARTREIKVGAIFTHRRPQGKDRPLRDYEATTYVADILPARDFGARLRQEAFIRGLARAQTVVFLGDGAAWVWKLARINFPTAVCILDFYHAAEHLAQLADALYGEGTAQAKQQFRRWRRALLKDQLSAVIAQAKTDLPKGKAAQKVARKQIAYLERNQKRMTYRTFRQAGYFIGSGVVEAACKTVVGQRFKQSGMLWSGKGLCRLLPIRCALLSGWFDEFWMHFNAPAKECLAAA
jgi:hypothetical protein